LKASDVAITDVTTTLSNYNASASYQFSEAFDGVLNNVGPYGALNTAITGQTIYEIELNLDVELSSIDIVYNYSVFNANSEFQWQGFDGSSWIAVSDTLTEAAATNNTNSYVLRSTGKTFSKYRLQGLSGTTYYNRIYEIVIHIENFRPEDFPKLSCTDDADNDGIYNHLDLDSDGDGCYDLAESGAGAIGDSLTTQNGAFVTVGLNGLADNIEMVADNDTILFTSSYGYAIDSAIVVCDDDNDNDLVGDLIDIDDSTFVLFRFQ